MKVPISKNTFRAKRFVVFKDIFFTPTVIQFEPAFETLRNECGIKFTTDEKTHEKISVMFCLRGKHEYPYRLVLERIGSLKRKKKK